MVRFPNRTGSSKKDVQSDNFLKLKDPGVCKYFVNCLNRGLTRMTRISRISLQRSDMSIENDMFK